MKWPMWQQKMTVMAMTKLMAKSVSVMIEINVANVAVEKKSVTMPVIMTAINNGIMSVMKMTAMKMRKWPMMESNQW